MSHIYNPYGLLLENESPYKNFFLSFSKPIEYVFKRPSVDTIHHISLREATQLLQYKSIKSTVRFCRNNQVPVFSDLGSRRKYVLKADFDLARLRATISHLRNRYGESHWQSALQAHLDDDLVGLLVLIENTKAQPKSQAIRGLYAGKFLTELNKALANAG